MTRPSTARQAPRAIAQSAVARGLERDESVVARFADPRQLQAPVVAAIDQTREGLARGLVTDEDPHLMPRPLQLEIQRAKSMLSPILSTRIPSA